MYKIKGNKNLFGLGAVVELCYFSQRVVPLSTAALAAYKQLYYIVSAFAGLTVTRAKWDFVLCIMFASNIPNCLTRGIVHIQHLLKRFLTLSLVIGFVN